MSVVETVEQLIEGSKTENGDIIMMDRVKMRVLGKTLFGDQFDTFSIPEKGERVCAEMEKIGWKYDEKLTTLFEMAVFNKNTPSA